MRLMHYKWIVFVKPRFALRCLSRLELELLGSGSRTHLYIYKYTRRRWGKCSKTSYFCLVKWRNVERCIQSSRVCFWVVWLSCNLQLWIYSQTDVFSQKVLLSHHFPPFMPRCVVCFPTVTRLMFSLSLVLILHLPYVWDFYSGFKC